jgi:hypothetical protein
MLGVPPTPAELNTFLRDRTPNAYAKQVERVLADPRYGERWARHWLDVVRFGESHGFERDQIRPHAWRYRDYVVNALNSDKPYNEFILEQIAGDVLEPFRAERVIATGFLVCAPWDEVGQTQISTVNRAKVREEEMEDILGTVGQTFLGLTVNCARCHDHKFDPITQKDYYRLKAALEGVRHGNRTLLSRDEQRAKEQVQKTLAESITQARSEMARLEAQGRERFLKAEGTPQVVLKTQPVARWTFDIDASDAVGSLHGTVFNGAKVAQGRLILGGSGGYLKTPPLPKEIRAKTLEAWVRLTDRDQQGGGVITLQTPDGSTFDSIVIGELEAGQWIAGSENLRRTRPVQGGREASAPTEWVHLAAVYSADNRITLYRNGVPYGVSYAPTGEGSTLRTFAKNTATILLGLRHTGAGNGALRGEIAEARLYDTALSKEQIAESYRIGIADVSLDGILAHYTAEEREDYKRLQITLRTIELHLANLSETPLAYAVTPIPPPPTNILLRGDVEKPAEAVTAGALECLSALQADFQLKPTETEGVRRLKLAQWIADPKNVLTWRVVANRVWHYHFGTGLVASPNDFGFNGERPSHPELLDTLALSLLKAGGSLKALHRLILLSSTYQQASQYNLKAARKDSENRLLWRFAPRRMEAEVIRDTMLTLSGQLNPQRGGESFQPFQVTISNSHFYTLFDSPDPKYNRRSIYRMQVHSAKSPLLETLDCPDPSTKTPRRAITTTPLQALELMNNTFVLRQAKYLAERIVREANKSLPEQVRLAYLLALGRNPKQSEQERAIAFVQKHSLATLCWSLLNSSEFLYLR